MTDNELKEERRRNDSLVLELVRGIKEKVESIEDSLNAKIQKDIEDTKKMLLEAFPNGDVQLHRTTHEAWLREMEERHRIRAAIIEKLAVGGVWAVVIALLTMAWYWLKGHL